MGEMATLPGLHVLIMAPPLVLSEADADKIVHALKTAFAKSLAS
ncbi:MAG: hypothetical protein R2865_00425 [Deinococcales bacterium]